MRVFSLAALAATAALAAAPAKQLSFPHTVLALPFDASNQVRATWVIRPGKSTSVASQTDAKLRFDVDGRGNPWFGDGARRLLTSPADNVVERASTPFSDFVFTQDGARVVCTEKYIGELRPAEDHKRENGLPLVRFWALAAMPHRDCRLAPAGPGAFYVIWRNEKNGDDEVSFVKVEDGKMRAEKLFGTDTRIAAVAGDGETTYMAVKNWIVRLPPGGGKHEFYYNPGRPVTGLAYAPGSGLFFATADAVGFVHPDFQIEFLKSPDPQIAVRGDALYIRLSKTLAVIKVSGIDRFKTFRWPESNAKK